MASALRIAITGATGYLGTLLSQHFSSQGHTVIALTRRRPESSCTKWRAFDLGEPVDPAMLEGVDVLIHAAWVLSGTDTRELWQQNVVGSRRLIDAAVMAGVPKHVFISSMSAYFGTRQTYGLMKLAVERTVLDQGGVVIRPGLVYGESSGGMAGTLRKISHLPLWPRFRSAKLFLAYERDIAPAMSAVLDAYSEMSGQVIGFANPRCHDLSSILMALSPDHRRRPTIPVSAGLVMMLLRLLESANVKLPFRSDSLLGLVESTGCLPGQNLLAERGVEFRDSGIEKF